MGTQGTRGSLTVVASLLALQVLIALFALAACGGSSTLTPDPTPEPTPTPSEAAIAPSPRWSQTMSPAAIPVVEPGQKPPPFSELRAMFAYDKSEPLDCATLLFINGKDDVSAMHDASVFLAAAPKASTWHVYTGVTIRAALRTSTGRPGC